MYVYVFVSSIIFFFTYLLRFAAIYLRDLIRFQSQRPNGHHSIQFYRVMLELFVRTFVFVCACVSFVPLNLILTVCSINTLQCSMFTLIWFWMIRMKSQQKKKGNGTQSEKQFIQRNGVRCIETEKECAAHSIETNNAQFKSKHRFSSTPEMTCSRNNLQVLYVLYVTNRILPRCQQQQKHQHQSHDSDRT